MISCQAVKADAISVRDGDLVALQLINFTVKNPAAACAHTL